MKLALFPGTFNPPTLGHLDMIERAHKLCDKLYIGIGENINKSNELFSIQERIEMIQKITAHLKNVEVISFNGLVVDCMKKNNIHFLIRGLRAFSDYEYEFQMAIANRKLSGYETLFLMSSQNYSHISSSLIRQIGYFGHTLKDFVPESIEKTVLSRLSSKKQ